MQLLLPLLILAVPIACISWTLTHEELFREFRDYCVRRSEEDKTLISRKFFYVFTCEYCFSHYVTIVVLIITKYTILFSDWRGYLISFFSLIFIANVYMSLFAKVRINIKHEKKAIQKIDESLTDKEEKITK